MSATPLSNNKLLPPLKYVCLNEWWLAKPELQCQGLAVEGVTYGERQKKFVSAAIAKRYEANVLETKDGITVQLRGMINSAQTSENGFPFEVCEDFLLGFPDDWKKYTDHSFADKCVGDGATEFGYSNACMPKTAVDASPSTTHDKRNNGENGASDAAVVTPAGNLKNGKSMFGSTMPETKKIRRNQLSSDAGKACRMVTRSISKRTLAATSVGPVRRSPRLYNCRK